MNKNKQLAMNNVDLVAPGEQAVVYETIVELAGDIFVMQRSMNLASHGQIYIDYKYQQVDI